ncbi:MAG: ABC transporter permease [Saccharofermentanales bacterium]
MFWHVFSHRLKCIVRDKEMMFWTLLFPIILATFFNMAFANLNKHDLFNSINLAVVDNAEYQSDKNMQNFLSDVNSGEKKLFSIKVVSDEKAREMLKANEVSGYLDLSKGIGLYFKDTGFNQTIIKSVFDQYVQTFSMMTTITYQNPNAYGTGLIERLGNHKTYFSNDTGSTAKPDNTVIYFYTILAMACFYGGFMGMKEVDAIQADLTPQAARVNVAPTNKLKTFISAVSAASLIQLMTILILLAYIAFVIKIDFGNQIGYLLLLCVSGCVMGVSFGAMLCALIKGSEGLKTSILIGVSMTLSFLSGMMYVPVKYYVTQAVPAMAFLNPLNVITDGFYALYYYQTHTRFFINVGVLWIFAIIFATITILRLRRLKYASI